MCFKLSTQERWAMAAIHSIRSKVSIIIVSTYQLGIGGIAPYVDYRAEDCRVLEYGASWKTSEFPSTSDVAVLFPIGKQLWGERLFETGVAKKKTNNQTIGYLWFQQDSWTPPHTAISTMNARCSPASWYHVLGMNIAPLTVRHNIYGSM